MRRNKTMRRKLHHRQRSRRHRYRRRHTRKQKGGDLPVPAGALISVSTGGEYGVPFLAQKEDVEAMLEKGSLED